MRRAAPWNGYKEHTGPSKAVWVIGNNNEKNHHESIPTFTCASHSCGSRGSYPIRARCCYHALSHWRRMQCTGGTGHVPKHHRVQWHHVPASPLPYRSRQYPGMCLHGRLRRAESTDLLVQCCVNIACQSSRGAGICRSVSRNKCAEGGFDSGPLCPGNSDTFALFFSMLGCQLPLSLT